MRVVGVGQQGEPALSRHGHVAQHQIELIHREELAGLGRVGCGGALEADPVEQADEGATDRLLVVDNQDLRVRACSREGHGRAHGATVMLSRRSWVSDRPTGRECGSESGKSTVIVVPAPPTDEIVALPPARVAIP